jgi:hypothetical protein
MVVVVVCRMTPKCQESQSKQPLMNGELGIFYWAYEGGEGYKCFT